jgi:hypothetical protein
VTALFNPRAAFAAALLVLSGTAFAQVQPPAPDSLAPALPVPPASAHAAYGHELKELPLEQAQLLLRSAAGESWRVVSVHAPKASHKKVARKHKQITQECQAAMKFARAHKVHAYCAALYTHSTVLLSSKASR